MAVQGAVLDGELLARIGARPLTRAGERLLPVHDDLAALLPFGGLRRGTVIEVDEVSLLCAFLSSGSASGSWSAVVGAPSFGIVAAAELGVVLERTAFVSKPPADLAPTVVAALVDALDFVVIGTGVIVRPVDARRLTARARERGGVLFSLGPWPDAVDLRARVAAYRWEGIGSGCGHLQTCSVEVVVEGRGAATRARRGCLQLLGRPEEPSVDSKRADDLRIAREAG